VDRRGNGDELFFDAVPVETGNRGQPPRHRGAGFAFLLEAAGEQLDVRPFDVEDPQLMRRAPPRAER
jgi:hypothetical protein